MTTRAVQNSRAERVLIRLGTGAAALVAIAAAVNAFWPNKHLTPEVGQIFFSVLNLIPLLLFCLATKPTRQGYLDNEKKQLYRTLLERTAKVGEPAPRVDPDTNLVQVNLLVRQLHANIKWYAFFLIIVYLLYLLDNGPVFDAVLGGLSYYKYAHLYLNIATGTFNFLSAVFLFLAFKVLYAKTVNTEDNKPLDYYDKVTILSGLFLAVYVISSVVIITVSPKSADRSTLLSQIGKDIGAFEKEHGPAASKFVAEVGGIIEASRQGGKTEQVVLGDVKAALTSYEADTDKPAAELLTRIRSRIDVSEGEAVGDPSEFKVVLLKLFQLFIGSFNGLAMALLFGRYVSMEQAIYNMRAGVYDSRIYNEVIHIMTIYVLPIYALAQPLFGSFDVNVFGDPRIFANGVFFVCWVGKMFFLYLTYLFLKRRLVHLYLHAVIASHGIPQELAECFKPES